MIADLKKLVNLSNCILSEKFETIPNVIDINNKGIIKEFIVQIIMDLIFGGMV